MIRSYCTSQTIRWVINNFILEYDNTKYHTWYHNKCNYQHNNKQHESTSIYENVSITLGERNVPKENCKRDKYSALYNNEACALNCGPMRR